MPNIRSDTGAQETEGRPERRPSDAGGRGKGGDRGVLARLWAIYDRLETVLTVLALSITVLTVLVAAIGRSMGMPVRSAPQLALLFLIWAIVLGADICMKRGEHIRVSLLAGLLPSLARRALVALHLALIIPFLVFCIWYGFDLAAGNWQRQLGATGLSYGLITLALPVGCVLFLISILRRLGAHGLDATLEPEDHHQESPL